MSDRVQIACVAYVGLWSISPPLITSLFGRLLALLSMAIWVALEIFERPQSLLKPSIATLCAIVFLVYSSVVGALTDGTEDLIRNLPVMIFLSFLVISECYSRGRMHLLRPVFWMCLLVVPVWQLITILKFGEMRNVSRLLIRSSEEMLELQSQGVGGYALVYASLLTTPILLYCLRQRVFSGVLPNLLVATNLLLSIMLVVQAGYSIALVLLCLSLAVSLVVGKFSKVDLLRVSAVVVSGALLLMLFAPTLASLAIEQSRGTMYERKVDDLLLSFETDQSVGSVEDRRERYDRSIDLFISNPMLGVFSFDDIGKHSAVLDRLARFGIIFGGMFLYCAWYLPLRYIRRSQGLSFGISLAVGIVVIPFLSLNNAFPAFGLMLFIYFPAAVSFIEDRERVLTATAPPRLAPIRQGAP